MSNRIKTTKVATQRAKLPALPVVRTGNASLDAFLEAVRERLEVREGSRGNPFEAVVTKRDLQEMGVLSTSSIEQPSRVGGDGDLIIQLPGGGIGTLPVDDLVRRIQATKLYQSLIAGPNDPKRFDAFPDEVKRLLLQSIAEEAAKRGADIRRIEQKIQTAERSLAMRAEEITAAVDGASAGVRQTVAAYATENRALASTVTQVQARLDDVGGVTVEEAIIAIADSVDGLSGEWYVKIAAGNKIAGVGLSAWEDPDGNSDSAFIVLADKFAVVTPTDTITDPLNPPANRVPFAIDGNQLVINGDVRINTSSGSTLNQLGKGVVLTPSASMFSVDNLGTPTPSSITVTASFRGGLTGTVSWSVSPLVTLTGTGNSRTLSFVNMGANPSITFTASITDSTGTYSTALTIFKVQDGARGSLTGYGNRYSITSTSWSDGLASRVIHNMLTGGTGTAVLASTAHLRIGDTVTLTNSDQTSAWTKVWVGSAWIEPGVIIDGNLLVHGTVTAAAMAANSITAENGAIADLAVTTAKIGLLQVKEANIENLTIGTGKVKAEAISVISSGRATWTRYDGQYIAPDPDDGNQAGW